MPPSIPSPLTWSGSLVLNEQLLTVIEQCNLDKQAIRQIEQARQINHEKTAITAHGTDPENPLPAR
nr:hypothetical protein [Xenorhabdus mauleonii]